MLLSNCRRLEAVLHDAEDRIPARSRPPRGWALFGSAVMQQHGLRERISDVDVAVHHTLWECLARTISCKLMLPRPDHPPYLEYTVGGGKAHLFYAWRDDEPQISIPECVAMGERVNGWWCTPLWIIRNHKQASIDICMRRYGCVPPRWEKHIADRDAIDALAAAQQRR